MASDPPNPFFKNPHSQSKMLGTLKFEVDFVTSKKFPNTCAACSNLAKVWDADNQAFQKGIDNYTASLEKLLQMLDVFIREKSNNSKTAGQQDNYSRFDNCEFTILLLWQMRNVMAHNGAVVSQECKVNYEKIFRKKEEKTHPVIDLPPTLEIGKIFEIRHTDFKTVVDCVLGFIKGQVTVEDYAIFTKRVTMANFQIVGGYVYIALADGKLGFNIQTAANHGVNVNPKTMRIVRPPGTTFSFEDSRIHLKKGGSFPAKYIPNSEYDKTKKPDLDGL
jgi:hypothetical protein